MYTNLCSLDVLAGFDVQRQYYQCHAQSAPYMHIKSMIHWTVSWILKITSRQCSSLLSGQLKGLCKQGRRGFVHVPVLHPEFLHGLLPGKPHVCKTLDTGLGVLCLLLWLSWGLRRWLRWGWRRWCGCGCWGGWVPSGGRRGSASWRCGGWWIRGGRGRCTTRSCGDENQYRYLIINNLGLLNIFLHFCYKQQWC